MASKCDSEKSPNDSLAEDMVKKLLEAGLISPAKQSEVVAKLKAGNATSEDWKLWVDLSTGKDAGGSSGAH